LKPYDKIKKFDLNEADELGVSRDLFKKL